MITFVAKVIHFKVSSILDEGHFYICSKPGSPVVDGRWTWDKEVVTCKKCLKVLARHPAYMQCRSMKFTDEDDAVHDLKESGGKEK